MNKHKDHLASCLCCMNFEVESSEPGYSEYTPGSPMFVGCRFNHFEFNEYDVENTFEMMHDLGKDCKDFEAKD